MLLSFLYISVRLHPASVTSRQCDFITEKDGNNRKDRNFWIPFYVHFLFSSVRNERCKDRVFFANDQILDTKSEEGRSRMTEKRAPLTIMLKKRTLETIIARKKSGQ